MSKNTDRFRSIADELAATIRENEDTERLFYERKAAVLSANPLTVIFQRRREIADFLDMPSRKRRSLLQRRPPDPLLLETAALAEAALQVTARGLEVWNNAGLLTDEPLLPSTAFLLTMGFLDACFEAVR